VIIARALAAAAIAVGLAAWVVFLRMGLVLAHYDAKAHLVVARRIFDNITPGWQQIGAIWLPLPHLIHALPTQLDLFYRTGAFASLVSVACLGVTTYAGARLVLLMTGSRLAACVAAALLVLNPNILYIHVTPMTEPLLLAAVSLVVLWLYEWVPLNQDSVPVRLRLALVAATWTRYEAWPVLAAALAAALYAGWRLGAAPGVIARRAWRLGVWPAAAVGLFMVNSRITVGDWLVSDGFYVPDPTYEGELLRSVLAVWWGTHELGTRVTEVIACAAAGFLVIRALTRAAAAPLLVPAALVAYGVLPALAFHAGHPFRIRYMLPAAACSALFAGVAVGFLRREAAAVLAGESQVLVGTVASSIGFINAGRLRALATAGATRSKVLPELPTVAESGYPGFEAGVWYALSVPGATPKSIAERIRTEALKALRHADVQTALARQGLDPETSTPAELAARIKTETAMWASVIKDAGIRAE